MYDPTDLYAELNRKTIEALQRVVSQHTNKEISAEEYKAAVTAIWSVTAGLTNPEISELVDDALNALGQIQTKRGRVWFGKESAVVLSLNVGTNEVEVVTHGKAQRRITRTLDTQEAAQKTFNDFCKVFDQKFGTPIYGD